MVLAQDTSVVQAALATDVPEKAAADIQENGDQRASAGRYA